MGENDDEEADDEDEDEDGDEATIRDPTNNYIYLQRKG